MKGRRAASWPSSIASYPSTRWSPAVTQIVPWLSLVIAVLAALVSVFTAARTFSGQLPSVDFLVERDAGGEARYKLSVSNPTRRLLVLDHVEVFAPQADRVLIRPEGVTAYGVSSRAYEEIVLGSKNIKPVFLAVSAGQTRALDVEFRFAHEEEFDIKFGLCWSKGVPFPDRRFIARSFELDAAQLRSRKMAVDAATG